MFGRKKGGMDTAYGRRRALMTNRLMTIAVGGVLLYQCVQAYLQPDKTPLWFIIAMALLISGTAGVLIWNISTVRKLDKEAAEREEEAKALESKAETEELPEALKEPVETYGEGAEGQESDDGQD